LKNSIFDLNLRNSRFVTREIVEFVIEEFPNLKSLCICECPRIAVEDIITVFSEFKVRHDENSPGLGYKGRKLALTDLDFNLCGIDTAVHSDSEEYWFDGELVGPDLGTVELILFSICEDGFCMLANSVCEECEFGVVYYGDTCMMCEEGSDDIFEDLYMDEFGDYEDYGDYDGYEEELDYLEELGF
jgi:hypothetical protein